MEEYQNLIYDSAYLKITTIIYITHDYFTILKLFFSQIYNHTISYLNLLRIAKNFVILVAHCHYIKWHYLDCRKVRNALPKCGGGVKFHNNMDNPLHFRASLLPIENHTQSFIVALTRAPGHTIGVRCVVFLKIKICGQIINWQIYTFHLFRTSEKCKSSNTKCVA